MWITRGLKDKLTERLSAKRQCISGYYSVPIKMLRRLQVLKKTAESLILVVLLLDFCTFLSYS